MFVSVCELLNWTMNTKFNVEKKLVQLKLISDSANFYKKKTIIETLSYSNTTTMKRKKKQVLHWYFPVDNISGSLKITYKFCFLQILHNNSWIAVLHVFVVSLSFDFRLFWIKSLHFLHKLKCYNEPRCSLGL